MCKISHKNTNKRAFYIFFVFTLKNNYYLCKDKLHFGIKNE